MLLTIPFEWFVNIESVTIGIIPLKFEGYVC